MDAFEVKNPFLKEDAKLTYVGTTYFGQKRQIGVPMVVNEYQDGSSRPCSSAASSSAVAALEPPPRVGPGIASRGAGAADGTDPGQRLSCCRPTTR